MWFLRFGVSMYFGLLLLNLALAKPFLYNAPRAITGLVTSASASSSQPAEPFTNISDLRNNKSEKLQEAENPSDSDDAFGNEPFLPPQEMNNEVLPSLLSKKINKILAKLRFLSSLSGPAESPMESNNNDDDFQNELDQFDKEYEENVKNKNKNKNETEGEKSDSDNEANSSKVLQGNSSRFRSAATSGYEYPKLRFRSLEDVDSAKKTRYNIFGGNFGNSNAKNQMKKAALEDGNPTNEGKVMNVTPESFGLFLTEIIGTMVGLAYGAIAQFQNPLTTAAP